MKKSRKRKKANLPPAFAINGWKKVDVGDELLLGSEEGGFLELEELTPAAAAPPAAAAAAAAPKDDTAAHAAKLTPSSVKPKKRKKGSAEEGSKQGVMVASEAVAAKKKPRQKAAKGEGTTADLEGLKAKIAALQQENAALKYAIFLPHFSSLRAAASRTTQLVH